jgi:hypothetical protein
MYFLQIGAILKWYLLKYIFIGFNSGYRLLKYNVPFNGVGFPEPLTLKFNNLDEIVSIPVITQ